MCAHQAKNQNVKKNPTVAQMALANKAICFAMRNPPKGHSKMPYKDIQKLVCKKDGNKPTTAAMCQAASNFKKVKGMRGRPLGSNKTTKDEDKVLMKTFHKIRPPGHGITSRALHDALPESFPRRWVARRAGGGLQLKDMSQRRRHQRQILESQEVSEG